MFTRNSQLILRRLTFNPLTRQCKYNSQSSEAEQNDPAPYFFNNEIQNILRTITRPDPKKVFRTRKDGTKIYDPEYKFMTDEQLEKARKKSAEKCYEKLQMPPVLKQRPDIDRVFSKDPELQGHDECRYVFTDITFGINDSDRLIVVRDTDGKLREADWNERFRMNQIYFPTEGREIATPKMFQQENLDVIIKKEEYEYILDRACIQFEPNDPEYLRVTGSVYDAINNEKHFDKLLSTRHYGPLVFNLVWKKNIDSLLYDYIQKGNIDDANLLVKLYHRVHPSSKSAEVVGNNDDPLGVIQSFIELDSSMRGKLQAILESYKEIVISQKKLQEGIDKAHGRE
ncbi:hypothetical protein HCN44_003768 [Aphidius gifuensis]|uniref:28S ribosomal protein S22, mitochondrial n=1 Tax=Aphidius gifuensis TaxID=684658 RepID=A0A835CPA8_APHGI|nr:hypothetical protein HCN44_003768 [Aphidius gifuensis]